MAASPLPGRSSFGWHMGERTVQEMLGVSTASRPNPTSLEFPPAHGARIASNHLFSLGALDDEGRPWSTIWGGERGFAKRIAKGVLEIRALVDRQYDPVAQALLGSTTQGETARPVATEQKFMSGLSIDFDSRDRVKVMGKLLTGEARNHDDKVGEIQLAMAVQESTGNCPKYINKRDVQAHVPSPRLISTSLPLPQQAVDLIHKTDIIFISSTNGDSMDTNHRGGPVGFVRVASNEAEREDGSGGVVLVYPEYSGNRFYQNLGNLFLNPKIGIVVPDFETSDVLYLTGTAQLLLGEQATTVMPHCKLALQIHVQSARLVADGLPFRGRLGEMSPYAPPVRALASEPGVLKSTASTATLVTAELLKREVLTPSISRYTFALHSSAATAASGEKIPIKPWHAGQHVTLDFSGELDHGHMHMNDDNPQSLNDDYVRTFTITNLPPAHQLDEETQIDDGTSLEITVRKHGPATGFLSAHDMRVPLKLPILGFGGDESFRLPSRGVALNPGKSFQSIDQVVFVAAGVGITPLLAQAGGVLAAESQTKASLCVLWTLRAEDLPLAVNTFARVPGLASRTRLFVTGVSASPDLSVEELKHKGTDIVVGRLSESDVLAPSKVEGRQTKYYICTGAELSKTLLVWLAGQSVVTENFAY
ncbi:hypothetical protein FB567DRAFT_238216 [Paraphoma chrysanthemicola]|uniref:FAD-binding FR-type domain-containing protein n=1 Tax=Paraphoma chrysanthemicola TaxID=798071 RepID=A0A8K0RDV0_9PLEO|nr:hypothetical protein FB567DRAFT_238216 [Paraphoma chrysanthemicola]